MTVFVANASPQTDAPIQGGGWWPDVDPVAVRAAMRLDGAITADRLRSCIVAAVAAVHDELEAWRATQAAAGYASLTDVPSRQVDGASRLVMLYQRAVGKAALAEAAETYRSYDATDSGNQRADDLDPSITEARRDLRWAIRDFLGERRMTVELI